MAYVAPSTVTTLQTYTSAAHNIIVNDIIDHETRILALRNTTGIVPPSAYVYATGAKSVTSGSGFAWDAELWDTDNMFTSASSTTRLTCKTAGIYMVNACAIIQVSGTTCTNHEFGIYFNGNPVAQERSQVSVVAGEYIIHSVSFTRNLAVNDFLECVCTFSGGTLTRILDGRNWFSATMLGATS